MLLSDVIKMSKEVTISLGKDLPLRLEMNSGRCKFTFLITNRQIDTRVIARKKKAERAKMRPKALANTSNIPNISVSKFPDFLKSLDSIETISIKKIQQSIHETEDGAYTRLAEFLGFIVKKQSNYVITEIAKEIISDLLKNSRNAKLKIHRQAQEAIPEYIQLLNELSDQPHDVNSIVKTFSFSKSKNSDNSEQKIFLPLIQEWARHTNTGDRSELHDLPEELPLWHDIAATADTCLGSECEEYNECFVTRMRQKATEADVVIVNHHLLCADAAVRESAFGEVIPACTTLVVDEAHQLENVATQHFGISLNSHGVNELVRDVERLLTSQPLALQPDGRNTNEEIRQAFIKVTNQTKQFFAGLELAATSSIRSDDIRRTSDLIERKLRYTEESFSEHLENSNILAGA